MKYRLSPTGAYPSKASFAASMRNIPPMLAYGLAGIVLAILATIPLGLGWFVLGPVFVASVYTSYRDIFGISEIV